MTDLATKALSEAPNLLALVIVVYLFTNTIEKITKNFTSTIEARDKLYLDAINHLTERIDAMGVMKKPRSRISRGK